MEEKHEEQVKILDEHANVSLSIIVFTLIYSSITYVNNISLKSQLIVIILYVDRR